MSKKRFPARIPRYVAGIRAQETRSGARRSWWAAKWLSVLEGMGLKSRLGRGRNYAVSGQVVSFRMEGPHVEAEVVGTRSEPYRVAIDFRTPEGESRKRILAALRAEPMLVARLLADDMPREVEEAFAAEGFSLFPGGRLPDGEGGRRRYDMTTSCSCPDYANPCKHTSAALIILGEEVSRRPVALLELRGIMVEELYDED